MNQIMRDQIHLHLMFLVSLVSLPMHSYIQTLIHTLILHSFYTHSYQQVWTNTCCSHPLHGMEPSEIDTPQDVQNATVHGVKHAAIRKLDHELGIPSKQVPIEKFKFLTRLHYWAADTVTHGEKR